MIKEGCLNGVDEIYGMHNYPFGKKGSVECIPGPTMAEMSHLSITIIG